MGVQCFNIRIYSEKLNLQQRSNRAATEHHLKGMVDAVYVLEVSQNT